MFENLKDKEKEGENKEQKLDEKVDDIFSETEGPSDEEKEVPKEDAPNPIKPQSPESPKASEAPAESFDDLEKSRSRSGGILKKIFIVIIILVVIGVAAYFIYSLILVPQAEELEGEAGEDVVLDNADLDFINDVVNDPEVEEELDLTNGEPEEELIEEEPIEEELIEEEPIEEEEVVEEEELDADIQILKSIDSDGDGLSDYDETYVIGTDSFKPDTSGNSFNDLTEITNCYDPLSKEGEIDVSLFVDPELFMERFPEVVESCDLSLE
jgi:hypothetical protein